MMVKPATAAIGYNGLLDNDARKAMNSAFEAMSEWRDEVAASTERYQDKVFEKMAAAAKAAGWPESVVDTTRAQMQQATRMQLQVIDQLMDAWTEQMKNPGKISFPAGVGKGLPAFPPFQMPTMQGFDPSFGMDMAKYGFGTNPMAPFQFWMEATQMWQKQWADAMNHWMASVGQGGGTAARKPGSSR